MSQQSGLCQHPRKAFVQVVSSDGRPQVMEKCDECNANARGPGIWVSLMELFRLGIKREELPIWKDLRTPRQRGEQATLFD